MQTALLEVFVEGTDLFFLTPSLAQQLWW